MGPDERVNILLVDDEPANLLALETTLENPEYRLVRANSGMEALKAVLESDFAAILLDVVMDDMDGFETARFIRAREASRHTPIIFLTSFHRSDQAVTAGYEAGAVDFIFKPFQPSILRAKVKVLADLYRLNQQLKAQAEELAAAREAADAANRAKSEFLSRMSHELRTPMNSVLGFAQVLQMGDLRAEDREAIDQITNAGHLLIDLIDEVLDIARIEQSRLVLSPEPVPLTNVIDEVVGLLKPLAEGRKIRMVVTPGAPLVAQADRQRLKQALMNLLSNAIKYNRDEGSVTVTVEAAEPGRCRIAVTDTGPGIDAADARRIFEPFERAGAERTEIQGTGLGLTITRQIVEAMGGHVRVDSVVGEGSTFSLYLPLAAQVEGAPASQDTPAPAPASAMPCLVLYVEDNLSNIALMEHVVRWRPGTTLLTAFQAGLGLDLARQHHPDVILLDLNLPDMRGEDLLAELKADATTRDIPVVTVSADPSPERRNQVLGLGASMFLAKPIDVQAILRLIDSIASAAGGQAAPDADRARPGVLAGPGAGNP